MREILMLFVTALFNFVVVVMGVIVVAIETGQTSCRAGVSTSCSTTWRHQSSSIYGAVRLSPDSGLSMTGLSLAVIED